MAETEALTSIKSLAEGITQQCRSMVKKITSSINEAKAKVSAEKHQIERRKTLLQSTIEQLKERNSMLLEERQNLALETEAEQAEMQKLREEQIQIEKRLATSKAKGAKLQQGISAQEAAISAIRKELEQQEKKENKEAIKAQERISYYKEQLGLQIKPMSTGAVNFTFTIEQDKKYTIEHFFVIEIGSTYVIHKCSIEEKKYAPLLQSLKETQDLFAFIKEMGELFTREEREKENRVKESETVSK